MSKKMDKQKEAPFGCFGCPKKMDKQKEAPFGCYGCPKINGQARGNETGKVEVGKSQPFHI